MKSTQHYKFISGQLVKCIKPTTGLTLNHPYNVLIVHDSHLSVRALDGAVRKYFSYRFEPCEGSYTIGF
jgi:hypothetical protein